MYLDDTQDLMVVLNSDEITRWPNMVRQLRPYSKEQQNGQTTFKAVIDKSWMKLLIPQRPALEAGGLALLLTMRENESDIFYMDDAREILKYIYRLGLKGRHIVRKPEADFQDVQQRYNHNLKENLTVSYDSEERLLTLVPYRLANMIIGRDGQNITPIRLALMKLGIVTKVET